MCSALPAPDAGSLDLQDLDLEALGAMVAAYCARPYVVADDPFALAEELQEKRALINRLEVDFARDAAAFAATYNEALHVNPSPVSWLRESCHMTSHAAATAVCVGEQAARLRQSAAVCADGSIGFAHLGLMASTAQAIDESPSATAVFDETRLLAKARDLSVQRFRTLCSHVRHQADRDDFLAAQVADREWRAVTLTPCGEAGLEISGFLDPEGGAVLRTALEPLAVRAGPDDERSRAQRVADALVELCLHCLDTGAVPQRASQRAHLQVTSTLETLLDLVGAPAGEMESAGVIASATVQRFACDATITRVLLNAQSAVIDVGRSQRVVSGATRTALNVRDQGCRWPGCDRTPSWTAAHHVVHWTRGGRTDLDNLVLLCKPHHWKAHEGGWQLVKADDGAILTVPPLPQREPPWPDQPPPARAPATSVAA
jgi:hypothetical protein